MNEREAISAGAGSGHCRQCERPLPDGICFARLRRGETILEFCRPYCLEKFLSATSPLEEFPEPAYGATNLVMTDD